MGFCGSFRLVWLHPPDTAVGHDPLTTTATTTTTIDRLKQKRLINSFRSLKRYSNGILPLFEQYFNSQQNKSLLQL